jgi:hypothetical protein
VKRKWYGFSMRVFINSKKRLALLFAIVLAVFSTGMVIAHQCDLVSSDQIAMQHHHPGNDSLSTTAANPLNVPSNGSDRLINSGCAALFIVVLLLSRKYFNFGVSRSRLSSFVTSGRELAVTYRPQVFQLALSRPQLGVIRV